MACPGLIENALPFRTLADAMVLRNHLIHVLEEADVEENPELRRKLLTFVVGGGGFSGVEVMAELNDFVHAVKKNYLRLRNEPHRCVIVQAGDRILPEMSEPLAVFAERILRKRGVEILLKDKLLSATSERALLGSGIEIPCKTLISTVPSALPPALQKLDCAKERATPSEHGAGIERLRRAGLGARRLCFDQDRRGNEGSAYRAARDSGGHYGCHQHRRQYSWRKSRPVRLRRSWNPRVAGPWRPRWLKFLASSCPDLSRGFCGVVFT